MSSNTFLTITKQVIRKGAEIGLDEAGTRICGSAWPYVKNVMSPVVDQLQKRYPKLFLIDDPESVAAGKKAAEEISEDPKLQQMLSDGLSKLQDGQQEILHLLARNDETLQTIGKAIDRGFEQAQRTTDESSTHILAELQEIRAEIHTTAAPAMPPLSLKETSRQVQAYENDALRWLRSDPEISAERSRQARVLLNEAYKRTPNNTEIIDLFGYLEKIDAQVNFEFDNQPAAVQCLAKAAQYFTRALQQDPGDVSAMNGMSNVYHYGGDLDRALVLGRAVFQREERYGAATYDLAIYLEDLIKRDGPNSERLNELRRVYERLQKLMIEDPNLFPASDLDSVQQRLAELNALPKTA